MYLLPLRPTLLLCAFVCTVKLSAETKIGFERELPDSQRWAYEGADPLVIIKDEAGAVLDFKDTSETEQQSLTYKLDTLEAHDMVDKGFRFTARIKPGEVDEAVNNLQFGFRLPDLKPIGIRLAYRPASDFIGVSSYDFVGEKQPGGKAGGSGFIEIAGTYQPNATGAGGGIFTVEADGIELYAIQAMPDPGAKNQGIEINPNAYYPERKSHWLIESVKIVIP